MYFAWSMHSPFACLFRLRPQLSEVAGGNVMRLEAVGSVLCCAESSSLGALVQFSLVIK